MSAMDVAMEEEDSLACSSISSSSSALSASSSSSPTPEAASTNGTSKLLHHPSNVFPNNGLNKSGAAIINQSKTKVHSKSMYMNIKDGKTSDPSSLTTTSSSLSGSSSTVTPKVDKLFHCSVLPPQYQHDHGKLTVVLDIDETLVHARLPYDVYRQDEDRMNFNDSDYRGETFEISIRPGETFVVNKRPGLDKFLKDASDKYELIAYTAAVEEYAKPLIDQLDPDNKIFRHRLYRSHCVFANGHFVKDLRIVNRPLHRVVLVDNNAYCFLPQLANGIPISSFYNDHTDTALNVLFKFLQVLHIEKEVQPILREAFNLEKILAKDREQLLSGHESFT